MAKQRALRGQTERIFTSKRELAQQMDAMARSERMRAVWLLCGAIADAGRAADGDGWDARLEAQAENDAERAWERRS